MKWADSPAAAAWIEFLESEPWDRGEALQRRVEAVLPETPEKAVFYYANGDFRRGKPTPVDSER